VKTAPHQTISRRKRVAFSLFCALLAIAAVCVVGEIAARVAGHKPWDKPLYSPIENRLIRVEADDELGYRLRPGAFAVSYRDGYEARSTHSPDGHRVTRAQDRDETGPPKKAIWVLGCSFTYGQSLNDEETYPWLLQEMMPGQRIVNFGTVGYSNVQSLIQLKRALTGGAKPAVIVLAYASFHDERNSTLRSWRKWKQPGFIQPYAAFGPDGDLQYFIEPIQYTPFPLMRYSALMHFFEETYDRQEAVWLRSHDVSKAIVREFASVARANGIRFVVAGIGHDALTAEMLDFCKVEGIMTVDISVDLTDPQNVNLPHDELHPSPRANRIYAERLHSYLVSNRLAEE
jgi:hypothetical protein